MVHVVQEVPNWDKSFHTWLLEYKLEDKVKNSKLPWKISISQFANIVRIWLQGLRGVKELKFEKDGLVGLIMLWYANITCAFEHYLDQYSNH